MKPIYITALCLVCIAFGAALVPIAERVDSIFSPPGGSVAGSRSAQAHRIISTVELQRELNSRGYKLKVDGVCGPATQAAWNAECGHQYVRELMVREVE